MMLCQNLKQSMLYVTLDDSRAQKWRIGQHYRRLGVKTPITRSKITRIIVLQTPLAASLTIPDAYTTSTYLRCACITTTTRYSRSLQAYRYAIKQRHERWWR